MTSPDRVEQAAVLLGQAGLAPVVAELARRMGASDAPVVSVAVTLDDGGRHALADLLGLARVPPARTTVRTRKLHTALGVDDTGLRDVVEALAGPIGNRSAERTARREELAAAVDAVAVAAGPLGEPVVDWAVSALRSLPGPIAGRVEDVTAVLAVLADRNGREPLPVAAARVTGDPHAFDPGKRGGDLLVAGATACAGVDPPRSSVARRALLARFGLVADELSSTVAVWRMPLPAGHPLSAASGALVEAGEPAVLSLAMVQRWPVRFAGRVLCVENPSVLAVAAARRFPGPVVCSSGQPSAAVIQLVSQLVAAGARVDVHADFEPGGFALVNTLVAAGGVPWRMSASDYLAAVDRSSCDWDGLSHLPATPWDEALREEFAQLRVEVYEEQLLDLIL